MKKNMLIAVAGVVVVGGLATYLFWPQSQPEPVQVQAPPSHPPKTEAPKVVVAPPAPPSQPVQPVQPIQPPQPTLANSDSFMIDALAELVGNKSLMKIFHTDRVIKRIVATIDNLPDLRAPMKVMPIERAPGKFITAGEENDLTISPSNAERYTPYVKIAKAIDAKKLVELYVRLYPLFQGSYENLGYPKKYFNDRLIVALDDLLAAPDIKEPVKLVQPNVFYLYADPDLEERSIGQRILMRIGSSNEAIMKAKLRELKKELLLHMHGKKIGKAA
jgi:hypothetical protein